MAYVKKLEQFKENGEFTDLVLWVNKVPFKVHKVVVAAVDYIYGYIDFKARMEARRNNSEASPFSMSKREEMPTELDVTLGFKGDPEICSAVIEFLYRGDILLCPSLMSMFKSINRAKDIIEVAQCLLIPDILNQFNKEIKIFLTVDNIDMYWKFTLENDALTVAYERILGIIIANSMVSMGVRSVMPVRYSAINIRSLLVYPYGPYKFIVIDLKARAVYQIKTMPIPITDDGESKQTWPTLVAVGVGTHYTNLVIRCNESLLMLYDLKQKKFIVPSMPSISTDEFKEISGGNDSLYVVCGDQGRTLFHLCFVTETCFIPDQVPSNYYAVRISHWLYQTRTWEHNWYYNCDFTHSLMKMEPILRQFVVACHSYLVYLVGITTGSIMVVKVEFGIQDNFEITMARTKPGLVNITKENANKLSCVINTDGQLFIR